MPEYHGDITLGGLGDEVLAHRSRARNSPGFRIKVADAEVVRGAREDVWQTTRVVCFKLSHVNVFCSMFFSR